MIECDEADYVESVEANITVKPKYFWQFTKDRRINNSYPNSMKYLILLVR